MSEEIPIIVRVPAEAETPPAVTAPLPEPATPDEARAIEAAFALEQENQQVAGLLGLWTSALVLHDLAAENFREPEEEKPTRKKGTKEPLQ